MGDRIERTKSFFAAATLVAALCAVVANASDTQSNGEAIVEAYLALAVGTELPSETSLNDVITKRPLDDITIVVPFPLPSSFSYHFFSDVERVVEEISARSTGLKIQALRVEEASKFVSAPQVPVRNDAIVVHLGSRDEIRAAVALAAKDDPHLLEVYSELVDQAVQYDQDVCLMASRFVEAGVPVVGKAIVWIEDGSRVQECLYEEILQAFGISNDFQYDINSIFSDSIGVMRPSALDWCFWAIHTNAAIKPGMTREAAKAAALELVPAVCDPKITSLVDW